MCQHVILSGLFLFVIQHECTRLIYFNSNSFKLFVSFIGFSQPGHTHTLEYKYIVTLGRFQYFYSVLFRLKGLYDVIQWYGLLLI